MVQRFFLRSLPTQKLPASSFEWIYLNLLRSSGAFRSCCEGYLSKSKLGLGNQGSPLVKWATYMGGSSLIELVPLVFLLQGTTRKSGDLKKNTHA